MALIFAEGFEHTVIYNDLVDLEKVRDIFSRKRNFPFRFVGDVLLDDGQWIKLDIHVAPNINCIIDFKDGIYIDIKE